MVHDLSASLSLSLPEVPLDPVLSEAISASLWSTPLATSLKYPLLNTKSKALKLTGVLKAGGGWCPLAGSHSPPMEHHALTCHRRGPGLRNRRIKNQKGVMDKGELVLQDQGRY